MVEAPQSTPSPPSWPHGPIGLNVRYRDTRSNIRVVHVTISTGGGTGGGTGGSCPRRAAIEMPCMWKVRLVEDLANVTCKYMEDADYHVGFRLRVNRAVCLSSWCYAPNIASPLILLSLSPRSNNTRPQRVCIPRRLPRVADTS